MTCPKCKLESTCGCESCKERKGPLKTDNIMEGDFITCPYCKTKAHADAWLNLEYEEYEKRKIRISTVYGRVLDSILRFKKGLSIKVRCLLMK